MNLVYVMWPNKVKSLSVKWHKPRLQ